MPWPIALWSQPGDWFRRPWSNPYNPAISKSLEQPAIYLLLDKPLAYIAPLLPPQSRFYLIADIALPIMPDGKFDRRIRAGLNDPPPGGTWGLHTRDKPIREGLLERYGSGSMLPAPASKSRARGWGQPSRRVRWLRARNRTAACRGKPAVAMTSASCAWTGTSLIPRVYRRRGTRNDHPKGINGLLTITIY